MSLVSADHIQATADKIASEFHPEKIILFGSYAYGQPTPDSDVDLLIIMPFEGRAWPKKLEILNTVKPSYPVDLLLYRQTDAQQYYDEYDPFLRVAIDQGKLLYRQHQ